MKKQKLNVPTPRHQNENMHIEMTTTPEIFFPGQLIMVLRTDYFYFSSEKRIPIVFKILEFQSNQVSLAINN